jgi:ubiquitin C-terminal hydrolase
MQCLLSCNLFRKKLSNSKQTGDDNSMLRALIELISQIETKKKRSSVIDSKKFVLSVKKNNQEFNNEDHHDSHEFLIWLLDHLNEIAKNDNKKIKKFENESV